MTRQLVKKHTEYTSMDEYLAGYAITGDRLTSARGAGHCADLARRSNHREPWISRGWHTFDWT